MISQVIKLTRLQLTNLFGINEFLHTKDKGKKKRYIAFALIWVLLIIMLMGYAGGTAYGLAILGVPRIIPIYVYVVLSAFILIMSFFKAGSVLFATKGYEMLVSLPVTRSAIVISRFLYMYVTNMILSMLIMIPVMVVYGIFEKPDIIFYVICIIATLFVPCLPLTIASIIGAIITGISSRARHKSIVQAVLMVLVVVFVMAFTTNSPRNGDSISKEFIKDIAITFEKEISNIYPPAGWFASAIQGEWKSLIACIFVPLAILAMFVAILQRYYLSICMLLNASSAKNNYQFKEQKKSSAVKSLWKKELKRYFASSVYVTNTIVGYVLAVIAVIMIYFTGFDKLESIIGISGLEDILKNIIPFVVSALMCVVSITSCSISMEGKNFWLLQTLPVKTKDVINAKVLSALTIASPFYLVVVIFSCLILAPDIKGCIFAIVTPALYLVFNAIVGILINMMFPLIEWENEVRVVKQSAATFVAMIVGILSGLIPIGLVIVLGNLWSYIISLVVAIVLMIAIVILFRVVYKRDLNVKNSVKSKTIQ